MAVSSRCRLGLLSSTASERVDELGRNEPRTEELLSQVECRRRNISRASRVVAVSFYQLIPLGGVRTCRLVPEGELCYGWHNTSNALGATRTPRRRGDWARRERRDDAVRTPWLTFFQKIKYFFLEFSRRSGKFKYAVQTARKRLLI